MGAPMTDDLIQRLRTLMAEIEARLASGETTDDVSPKLRDALASLPPAYPTSETTPKAKTSQLDNDPGYCPPKAAYTRPTDYVPNDDAFPPEDFIGSGDSDPLGHDAMIRR